MNTFTLIREEQIRRKQTPIQWIVTTENVNLINKSNSNSNDNNNKEEEKEDLDKGNNDRKDIDMEKSIMNPASISL